MYFMQVTQGNVLSHYRKFNQIAIVTSTKLQGPVIRAMVKDGNDFLNNPDTVDYPKDRKYLPKQFKEICILRAIQNNVPKDPTLRKRLETRLQYIFDNHTEEQIIEQKKKDGTFERPVEPFVEGPITKEFFIDVYKNTFDNMTKIKSKKFNENTLNKFISRSNKFYHELHSKYEGEDLMEIAVLKEVWNDIKDTKVKDFASELIDNKMELLFPVVERDEYNENYDDVEEGDNDHDLSFD